MNDTVPLRAEEPIEVKKSTGILSRINLADKVRDHIDWNASRLGLRNQSPSRAANEVGLVTIPH
jgi:hypothetical protein